MTPNEKRKSIQEILGVLPDGVFGSLTDAAYAALKVAKDETAPPPAPTVLSSGVDLRSNNWPKEADASKYFGLSDGSSSWESAHLTTITPPYAMNMDGEKITKIRCNKLVAPSLTRILNAIYTLYDFDIEKIKAVGLDRYDGCYNFRQVRGSATKLSMHAYGAAIDFDAADNPLGANKGLMPAGVVAIFEKESWRWGGRYTGRKDWMHFEACV